MEQHYHHQHNPHYYYHHSNNNITIYNESTTPCSIDSTSFPSSNNEIVHITSHYKWSTNNCVGWLTGWLLSAYHLLRILQISSLSSHQIALNVWGFCFPCLSFFLNISLLNSLALLLLQQLFNQIYCPTEIRDSTRIRSNNCDKFFTCFFLLFIGSKCSQLPMQNTLKIDTWKDKRNSIF